MTDLLHSSVNLKEERLYMDVLTLNFVNVFIAIAATLSIFLLYKQNSQKYLLYWMAAGGFLLTQSILSIFYRAAYAMPFWLVPAAANTSTISIHILLLAGLYQHTQNAFKSRWLIAILLISYAANLTEFAQISVTNRLLLNFPIIIGLNALGLVLLLRQPKNTLSSVYNIFIIAFAVNITQLIIRYMMIILDLSGISQLINTELIYSLGHFGLTTFAMLVFGNCLYLVYRQQQITLQHSAEHDPLTGVFNRRILDTKLQIELQRSARMGQHCSIIMLDIDHFKQINDTLGHVIGDKVIRRVADLAKHELRLYDIIFRYGGEEFLIFLPDTQASVAVSIANRIRHQVEQSNLPDCASTSFTVSSGVATYTGGNIDWQQFISQADNAMYQSKKLGRNQSIHFNHLLHNAEQ